jgi:hypothetical protein
VPDQVGSDEKQLRAEVTRLLGSIKFITAIRQTRGDQLVVGEKQLFYAWSLLTPYERAVLLEIYVYGPRHDELTLLAKAQDHTIWWVTQPLKFRLIERVQEALWPTHSLTGLPDPLRRALQCQGINSPQDLYKRLGTILDEREMRFGPSAYRQLSQWLAARGHEPLEPYIPAAHRQRAGLPPLEPSAPASALDPVPTQS